MGNPKMCFYAPQTLRRRTMIKITSIPHLRHLQYHLKVVGGDALPFGFVIGFIHIRALCIFRILLRVCIIEGTVGFNVSKLNGCAYEVQKISSRGVLT